MIKSKRRKNRDKSVKGFIDIFNQLKSAGYDIILESHKARITSTLPSEYVVEAVYIDEIKAWEKEFSEQPSPAIYDMNSNLGENK